MNQADDQEDDDVEMQQDDGVNTDDGDNRLTFTGNLTADNEMITIEIDLTDPDDLMRKLDMVDLTDDETDLLLDRARRLNVWLREQLMQHEQATSSSAAIAAAPCRHPGIDEPHRHSATCVVSAPAAALSDDDDGDDGGHTEGTCHQGHERPRTYSGSTSAAGSALPPLVGPGRRGSTGMPSLSSSVSYTRDPMAPYYSRYGLAGVLPRRPSSLHNSVVSTFKACMSKHCYSRTAILQGIG